MTVSCKATYLALPLAFLVAPDVLAVRACELAAAKGVKCCTSRRGVAAAPGEA